MSAEIPSNSQSIFFKFLFIYSFLILKSWKIRRWIFFRILSFRIHFWLWCPLLCTNSFLFKRSCWRFSTNSVNSLWFSKSSYLFNFRFFCRPNQRIDPSERYHFPVGSNQQFYHFIFKPHRYDLKYMHWDGTSAYFPVLIEMRSVSDKFQEQVFLNFCLKFWLGFGSDHSFKDIHETQPWFT